MAERTHSDVETLLQEKIICCAMLERLAEEELGALQGDSAVLLNKILRKKITLIRKIDAIDGTLEPCLSALTHTNRLRLAPKIETLRTALERLQALQQRATQLVRQSQSRLREEMNRLAGGRRLLARYHPNRDEAPRRFLHRQRV